MMFKYFSVILISVSFFWAVTSHAEESGSVYIDETKPTVIDEPLQHSPEKILVLETLADQGDIEAMTTLGFAYMIGNGVERDPEFARVLLETAAKSKDPYPLTVLATYYSYYGSPEDQKKIIQLQKMSADAGDEGAAFNLGINYLVGNFGAEVDYGLAREYLLKAAENNAIAPQALYYLAQMPLHGLGEEQDLEFALETIELSAEAGYWEAQFDLAEFYDYGTIVEQDAQKAHEWYLKAAENGHSEAQWRTGLAYVYGKVVEKNSEEAVKWFQKSANNGNSDGKTSLAVMYATGDGIEQSFEKAFELYREAALAGNSQAIKNMGYMYWEGQFVEEDSYFGAVLFEAGVYLGNSEAESLANIYREQNSEDVIAKVKADARAWLEENNISYEKD